MRVSAICMILGLTACEPDVGIPDDWAVDFVPRATREIVSDGCDGLTPPAWEVEAVRIDNPSPRPGTTAFRMEYADWVLPTCVATDQGSTFEFVCDEETPINIWVNEDERDCPGYATLHTSGEFLGPRSVVIDTRFDVNNCPCENSCTPYPAPCEVSVRITYEDP